MKRIDRHDKRRDMRYDVFEHCRVVAEGWEYEGAVIDMSMGGAGFQLDVQIEAPPEMRLKVGTPVFLCIDRIGRVPAKVARSVSNGIAIKFNIGRDADDHLVAALKQILDEYRSEDG